MDFIERLTGLSPDHGSGALEAAWIVGLLIAAALPLAARLAGYRRNRRRISP